MRTKNSNLRNTLAFLPPSAVAFIWLFELAMSSELALTKAIAPQLVERITVPSSHRTNDLASSLGISKDNPGKCNNKFKNIKVWISPYRQFPEAGDPGIYASRGLADYEYLSLLRGDPCTKLKANYGAFKYSPANTIFEKARNEGIEAEMSQAKKLKFDSFILDLNKVWVTSDELKKKCRAIAECRITSDNFALISLKDKEASAGITKAMRYVVTKPNGVPVEYFKELMGFNSTNWEPIEISPDGKSLWSWSKSTRPYSIFSLSGKRLASSPTNLEILLKPAPTITKLVLRMNCRNGQAIRRLTASKEVSISHLLRDCQPESIMVESFSTRNSQVQVMHMPQVPTLGQDDTRRSLFAIKAEQ